VNPVIKKNYDVTVAFSAWGMYSTIEDLQKWNEELYTEKLLSRKYLDIYFTPYKDNWACDWMILKNKPFYYANDSSIATYRGGNFGPFECFTVRYAKERHSIVLMGNCSYSRAEEIIKNITGILFNKPYTLPKQSLQKTFSEILDKKGLPNASDDILNKAKDTNTYYISASEFLHLGYAYKYEKKDLKAAIQVFELMAKLFPTTYNAYDSEYFSDRSNVYGILGSCYLEDGQKEKAIVNFKKAITLNPDDTNAIELIKKLEKE
jgi:tetratricopeptide (TPR) repeat protein